MAKEINQVAIVGMGALGVLFGAHIQKGIGAENVYFLMDEKRKEKYAGSTVYENGEERKFQMLSDKDVRESDAKQAADLVIVSVKYLALPEAIDLLEASKAVGEHTIIISLMNGIDSEEMIAERFGMDKIVYCVAQGMDAMKFGNELKYTKMGELHIGVPKGEEYKENQEKLDTLQKFFDRIKMPYVKEEDILYRMWAKFMLNVGVNQTCMAYGTTYSGVLRAGEAHDTFVDAMRETVKIANAESVSLGEKEVQAYIDILETLSPDGVPSMAQDRINKKYSEVDMFAGKIIKLAKKHGIDVPANEKLYRMVQEIEKKEIG